LEAGFSWLLEVILAVLGDWDYPEKDAKVEQVLVAMAGDQILLVKAPTLEQALASPRELELLFLVHLWILDPLLHLQLLK